MQYAWLNLFGGKWVLLDGNLKHPARSWPDENLALAQLKEEGWTISGSHQKHPSNLTSMNRPKRKSRGYTMTRTVH